MRRVFTFALAAVVAGGLTAWAGAQPMPTPQPAMDMSPPVSWTDTGAKAYVTRGGDGAVASIGLAIPGAVVRSTPTKRSEAVVPISDAGLVRSANLQWHPRGHEPAHVYDVPHFDLHFYTIAEDVRSNVLPGTPQAAVTPAPELLPPDSIVSTDVVPMMGMHVISKAAPEMRGGAFGVTPILGFWNGDLAFFEVMFTADWLRATPDYAGEFPQPQAVRAHGGYPGGYAVHYDRAADVYHVELTGMHTR